MWMGKPDIGYRPYDQGCRSDEYGEPSYERFISYWANGLPEVGTKLEDKLKVTGFKMRPSNSGKNYLEDHTAVEGMVPGVISYVCAIGKYHAQNRLVFYHELPVQWHPDSQWWPVQVLLLRPDIQHQYDVTMTRNQILATSKSSSTTQKQNRRSECRRLERIVAG